MGKASTTFNVSYCSECSRRLDHSKTGARRIVCSDKCAKRRKARLQFEALKVKRPDSVKCANEECETTFPPSSRFNIYCSTPCRLKCKNTKKTDDAERDIAPRTLLGPAHAPLPTHVCAGYKGHECSVKTASRRCHKCRAMHKYLSAADGSTASFDLFSGGHVDCTCAAL